MRFQEKPDLAIHYLTFSTSEPKRNFIVKTEAVPRVRHDFDTRVTIAAENCAKVWAPNLALSNRPVARDPAKELP